MTPDNYSTAVSTELLALSANLRIARKRRKISIKQLAARAESSVSTVSRLEQGDPTVAIGTLFRVLDCLGLLSGISQIADPENDLAQLLSEVRVLRGARGANKVKEFSDEELKF